MPCRRSRTDSRPIGSLASLAVFLSCTGAVPISAAPIAVVNPGFEDISGEGVSNEFTFGPLNGWDLYEETPGQTSGGTGPNYYIGTLTPFETDPVTNPGIYTYFPDGAPEGQRVGIAFNFFESAGGGEYGLVQTLGDTLQPNTAYQLQVLVGNIDSGTAMSGEFFPLSGFPGYRIDLLAGGEILEPDNVILATPADGEFALATVNFTTGESHDRLGQNLGIRLVNLNTVDTSDPSFALSDLEVDFDDVSLTATPIPEPGVLGLMGLGMLSLATTRVRRIGHTQHKPQYQRGLMA